MTQATGLLNLTPDRSHADEPAMREIDASFPQTLRERIDASAPRRLSREQRRIAQVDPTSAAVAELASSGPVKPIQARAAEMQRSEGQEQPAEQASPQPSREHSDSSQKPSSAEPRDTERPASQVQSGSRVRGRGESQERASQDKPSHESNATAPSAQQQAPTPSGPRPMAPQTVQAAGANARIVPIVGPRVAGPGSVTSGAARGAVSGTKASGAISGKARAVAQTPRFKLAPGDEKIAAQIGRGLAAALRQGGGTVTLRLQPEALGHVKVRMQLQHGKVGASFEVGSDQARRLLEKSKDTLRSALEAKGLAVERLEVQMSPHAAGEPALSGQHPGGSGSGSEHPGGGGMSQRPARTPVEPQAEESAHQGRDEPWMGDIAGGALRLDALA